MTKKILVLPGDGIGPEIVAEAVKVLDRLVADGLDVELMHGLVGGSAYDAKGHFGMTAMRLQGQGVTDFADNWVGFSTFLPGGGAEWSSAPTGKVYVVLEGEITVTTADGDTVLKKFDSCHIPPNTERSIVNNTNHIVQMLVFSPN